MCLLGRICTKSTLDVRTEFRRSESAGHGDREK